MTSPVYNLHHEGLGDHWASISYLAQLSIARGELIRFHSKPEHAFRHLQILSVLGLAGAQLLPCTEPGTASIDGFNLWATEYLRTKEQWRRPSGEHFVTMHFKGISAAADKNPSSDQIAEIKVWAAKQGMSWVELGQHMTLDLVVDSLRRCALFVGCDSGFSHIAHSISCPTYILEYGLPVVTCHRHKPYVLCKGAGHFIQQAENWLGYLRSLR